MSRCSTPCWWACSRASAAWMPRRAAFWKKARQRVNLPDEDSGDGAGAGRAGDGAASAANEAVGSPAFGPGWVASSGTEASPVASAKARSFSAEGLSAP